MDEGPQTRAQQSCEWSACHSSVAGRDEQTGASTAVVEAAVMMEAGWESFMDEVWVVAVEPQVAR